MRFILLCLMLCVGSLVFAQSDSSFNYYQASNNRYIVEIKQHVAYVYRAKVFPDFIAVYSIDTLRNVLIDSTSDKHLPLFYTDEWTSVEKRDLAYFLTLSNGGQRPRKSLDLNPIMEQQEMERAINDFQRTEFQSARIDELSKEFHDYFGYWENETVEAALDEIPQNLPREAYLTEMQRFEQAVYDSVRELNVRYTRFIDRVWEESVSLDEAIEFYTDVTSRGSDFVNYKHHMINDLIDKHPQLFFGLAASIESKEEREELYLSLSHRRYIKLKGTEADADIKAEFRRVHRNNTIINIGLYTLESVFTLVATWLLNI